MKGALFICFMTIALISHGNKSSITACFTDWAPFSYLENGQAKGFSIDIYKAVTERAGLNVQFVHRPWKRCKQDLESGRVDAAVDGGAELENSLSAERRPVPWVMAFWVKESSPYQEFQSYSQFDGKSVLYVRGYGYPDEFLNYKGFRATNTATDLQALEVLAKRTADAFLGDMVSGANLAKIHSLPVRPLTPVINMQWLTLVFHNSLVNEHKRFESALNAMYEDGSIDAIYKKYLNISHQDFIKKYSVAM